MTEKRFKSTFIMNDMDDCLKYDINKAYEEMFKKMYKECEKGFLTILDEYIKFWSDPSVQEFYYDVFPLDVLKEVRHTVLTGEWAWEKDK